MAAPVPESSDNPFGSEFGLGVLLWKASDVVFKIVGWCLAIGAVDFGYKQTHDWRLGLIRAFLFTLLAVTLIMLFRPAVMAAAAFLGVYAKRALPRRAHIVIYAVTALLIFGVVFCGLSIIEVVASILSKLR